MENNTVFRDKSIERISSPEQLNDYIKLSNPGVFLILGAIIIILAGACIFGIAGHMDSSVPGVTISDNGNVTCLVKKEYGDRFTENMYVKLPDGEYGVSLRDARPEAVSDNTDSYALFVGNIQPGEWVYVIDVDGSIPDGVYDTRLVTERISPIRFLFR